MKLTNFTSPPIHYLFECPHPCYEGSHPLNGAFENGERERKERHCSATQSIFEGKKEDALILLD